MKRLALVLVTGACGSVSGNDKMDARIDSPSIVDAAPDASTRRCDPAKPFGAAVAFDELNTVDAEGGVSLSADEKTIYFYSNRGGAGTLGSNDIFVATRSSLDTPFGAAAPLAGVNSVESEEMPSVTADGLFMYFDRLLPNTSGWDIWVSQRASTSVDFGTPMMIGSPLNSGGMNEDSNQFMKLDNSAMYFISNRTGARDIYRSARNIGGTFDQPVVVNPTANEQETAVAVTADELTMYFSTDKTGTLGVYDIWTTKRSTTQDGWGMPVHLTDLSTATSDLVTWVSPDGCDLYMMRDVTNRSYDLYWARKPL